MDLQGLEICHPGAICSFASSNFGLNTDICDPLKVKINLAEDEGFFLYNKRPPLFY
jgi:hypothetical protein